MRWPVFACFALAFLVIDVSFAQVVMLGGYAPSFTVALVTYLALFAPRLTALWAAWWLGLLLDLATEIPHGPGRSAPMIGPHALGFVFACFALLQVRSMLIRRHLVTVAIAAFAVGVMAALVRVFVVAAHGWYEPDVIGFARGSAMAELGWEVGRAAYSAIVAGVLAPVLLWTEPLWSFRHQPGRMVV